ncbi:MAG: peptide-methionine (R)-S-oxide reductase MsrB [Hyphomicrobiaceae bacterium]
MRDPTRRRFAATMIGGVAAASGGVLLLRHIPVAASDKPVKKFEIERTPEEWRKLLTPQQYYVLREHGTERAFTHPYDKLYDAGVYHCAGCDLPLFSSTTKYDSRTGWPSFWKPLDNAIGTKEDRSWFMVRTEVHCRRCGGHLGHVFDDGPPPTRLRYCMNGTAMKFVPAASGSPQEQQSVEKKS